MIICMYDIICVTNRKLCTDVFTDRLRRIAETDVSGIILREKDLSEGEYEQLSESVIKEAGKKIILHSFDKTARKLDFRRIHLPISLLRDLRDKEYYQVIGASCHSIAEAVEAESLGCTYITAGHIFDTDCKKGLQGRGLDFLTEVCRSVSIPVYAIGGITKDNIASVFNAGASGVCVMSSLMECCDPKEYIFELRSAVK